jgi:hypothetical protein
MSEPASGPAPSHGAKGLLSLSSAGVTSALVTQLSSLPLGEGAPLVQPVAPAIDIRIQPFQVRDPCRTVVGTHRS